jgi:hypothetical protein
MKHILYGFGNAKPQGVTIANLDFSKILAPDEDDEY